MIFGAVAHVGKFRIGFSNVTRGKICVAEVRQFSADSLEVCRIHQTRRDFEKSDAEMTLVEIFYPETFKRKFAKT